MGRHDPPSWFGLPAISQVSVSGPYVLRAFDGFNAGRVPREQIRPFNFCLSAHVAPFGHPEGVDPLRFHLVAPYADVPQTYLFLDWVDRYSACSYRVTTIDDHGISGAVLVQTHGDVFARYARHLEAKSLDAVGEAGRGSGLLARRPIREGSRAYIGKESNQIEEVEVGLLHRLDDVMQEYGRLHDPWRHFVVPVLREMPLRLLIEDTGLNRRTLQRLRNGDARPHRRNEVEVTRVVSAWARRYLADRGIAASRSDLLACRAWLEARD